MKRLLLAVPIVLVACSVTRPISLPVPSTKDERPTVYPALFVTDSAGRGRWGYDAWVERDTLRGLRAPDMPRERIALPISQVKAVAASRFSPARTFGLLGGLAGVLGALALMAPDPDYSLGYR